MELVLRDGGNLNVTNGDFWKDETFFYQIEKMGFSNVDWENAPDEFLVYLFLHDQPTIGQKRTEQTKKEYLRDLNQFFSYLYNPVNNLGSLRNINPEDLLVYQRYLQTRYKNTTLSRKTSVIRHFFRYLASKDILKRDITLQMKRPKMKSTELVNRDLYDHEVKLLLAYFKQTDWFAYTLFYILVATGMRINELATAKWANFRFEPAIGYHFLKVMGKGEKERDAIIFDDVLEVVIENRKRKSLSIDVGKFDGTAFFPKATGLHYNSTYLSNEFTRLVNSAPFDFIQARFHKEEVSRQEGKNIRYRITPHTCRHYTAAYYMDNGIDPKAIQDMLGHSSLHTTERYLRRKRSLENHAGVKLGEKNFISN